MATKRKNDWILVLVFLGLGLCALLLVRGLQQPGAWAVVLQGGEETGRYPLHRDAAISIEGPEGYNLLVIEGGAAYISEADCPNGLCMKAGKISQGGQSLICLPHGLTVRIEGPGLDGVSG
ncbi:MAG: NusG domain II-containing protein [Clostridia bacterium]|nr:NusG domain II-containing protein [Clostridia bacterium]